MKSFSSLLSKILNFQLIIFIALQAAFLCYSNSFAQSPTSSSQTINSFEECSTTNSKIITTFPRQCLTSSGQKFESTSDRLSFDKDDSCKLNSDCVLINLNHGYGCCWTGACERIDYSKSEWQAVNSTWFKSLQSKHCPRTEDCGPRPLCAAQAINESYIAKCYYDKCTKQYKR